MYKALTGEEYLPNDPTVFKFKFETENYIAHLKPITEVVAFYTDTIDKGSNIIRYAEGNFQSNRTYLTFYEYNTSTNQLDRTCVFQEN